MDHNRTPYGADSFNDQKNRFQLNTTGEAAEVNQGLRNYMLRVYSYMSLGVAFTGGVSMYISSNQGLLETISGMFWLLFIAILAMGLVVPYLMTTKSLFTAQVSFWVYAGLWGVILGPIFAHYISSDPMLIVRAFMITAVTFLSMSLIGYTTKRNLSGLGIFFMMATIGVLVAIMANVFFFQDTGLQLILSIIVVLLFSGLTAYETQNIKELYREGDGDEITNKAVFGAFMLYGSFVTLFVHILNILGIMNE